ncbi:hypothetical protein [Chitinimonas sp. BJB300]|uniref:hypothetical protein n=1 Tax=Chitinimonas sp. BJB300 TaxID=1559339 RepID=UPI00117E1943|nr:hypothetical protein [Chitinimonas sp. BJB300]
MLHFDITAGSLRLHAPMESLWGSLKHELVHHRKYPAGSIYPRKALLVYGVRRASMKRWSSS